MAVRRSGRDKSVQGEQHVMGDIRISVLVY
jgi:hypothetical protein